MEWRSFSLYIAKAVTALLAVVVHGLIGRYLGVDGYGYFTLFIGLSFLATQLGDLGAAMLGAKEVSVDPSQARIIQQLRFVGYIGAMTVYALVCLAFPIQDLQVGLIAIVAFFGITDWALRGQGRPEVAAMRQVTQALLQVALLFLVVQFGPDGKLGWAIAGFAGGTLLSTLVTWKQSYQVLLSHRSQGATTGTRRAVSKHLQTFKRLAPGHLGALLLHAQYQVPLIALPLVAAPEVAGRYGAAYVIFAGLSSAVVITQDIFLPKGSMRRQYIGWQVASSLPPVIILLLLPRYGHIIFGPEFRLDLPLAAAFATLMFAYGLRYLSIQMRLFQRQYLAFAELNLWSLTIQAMVWFYTLSTDGQMTAERAALTLAASEALVALVAWLRPTPEQPLAIGLLTHNGQDELFAGLGRWAKKVRADRIWAVDTGDRAAPWAESLNNDNFEFGGYLQLAQNMAESHEGPYLIFNDRLFYHRWSRGWSWLMRRRDLFEGGHYIAGDRHIESCGAPELAEAYLSSWVFYIPNRELLQTFINACEQAIAHDSSDESEAYQAFINTWLNATSGPRHRGARDQATLLRKAQTIRMEHALSAALRNQNVQLRNIPLYAGYYRSIDRIINRFR